MSKHGSSRTRAAVTRMRRDYRNRLSHTARQ
jgi:hypothetical protein